MTKTTLTTDLRECRQLEADFDAYVNELSRVLGHADRIAPFSAYCKGLLLPGERKSVEPMAARTAPDRVRSQHQSMHHFVADAPPVGSGPARRRAPLHPALHRAAGADPGLDH